MNMKDVFELYKATPRDKVINNKSVLVLIISLVFAAAAVCTISILLYYWKHSQHCPALFVSLWYIHFQHFDIFKNCQISI